MKNKTLPALFAGVVLGGTAAWVWLRHPAAPETPAAEKTAASEPGEAHAGVRLTDAQIASAGIKVGSPTWQTIAPIVEGYGRVLDPAPLLAAAAEVVTAQVTASASAKELARVQALHDEGNNASAQAVEAADAAARRDRVQSTAARARFAAAWGPALTSQLEQAGLEHLLLAEGALVRVEVPANSGLLAEPLLEVQLMIPNDPTRRFSGHVLGPTMGVDPQFQGTSFLVQVPERVLAVGLALRAELPARDAPARYAVVPASALVRHEGSTFVYVPSATRTFVRRRVEPQRIVDGGVALLSGLGEHDAVVLVGAQQLLSTELGSSAGED